MVKKSFFCQAFFDKPPQDFLAALSTVNFEVVKKRQQEISQKTQQRGQKMRVIHQTGKVLDYLLNNWQ